MPRQHVFESVADELADWLGATSDALVEGLVGAGPAPFAAKASEAEKLDYYERQLWNPDGSPNISGRQREMDRLGPTQWAEVFSQVEQRRRRPLGLETMQASEPQVRRY